MYALIKILSEGYMNLLEARDVLEKRGQKLLEELYGKSGVDDNLKRYEAVLNGFLKELEERRFQETIRTITTARYLEEA